MHICGLTNGARSEDAPADTSAERVQGNTECPGRLSLARRKVENLEVYFTTNQQGRRWIERANAIGVFGCGPLEIEIGGGEEIRTPFHIPSADKIIHLRWPAGIFL